MKIILKVDDFRNDDCLEGVFGSFLNFVNDQNIKISLGIIGDGFEFCSQDCSEFIRKNKNIETFNHSYYHLLNPHIISEFCNTNRKYQFESIKKTNEAIEKRLGRQNKVIGFVANSFDNVTVEVVKNCNIITHIYALAGNDLLDLISSIGKNILIVNEDVVIEKENTIIKLGKFIEDFKLIEDKKLTIFQLHPGAWTEDMLQEFKEIIKFLLDKKCEFIFPTEYE